MSDDTNSADSVVIECDLPHPPEKVWRALTDQDLLGRWLMPNDLQPEVGARFRLLPAEPMHEAPLVDCEVIEARPPRVLAWRQIERETATDDSQVESIVTFELVPSTSGTHLRVVHGQFRRLAIEARTSETNVVRFERRNPSLRSERPRSRTIVCAMKTFRRVA